MSVALCLSTETPADIHEAMRHEFWKAAVHNEFQALLHNNTWSLYSLPINRRAIGYKWILKVKKKADGTVERYKARLVAKGFSQHARLDFRDTFSPVVRVVTIRTILAISVMKGWSLRQIDVNNAFLNGELIEEIYMDQPPGFEVSGHNAHKLVCRLNKALYGLCQAPHGLLLSQKNYDLEILHKTGMIGVAASPTPMVSTPKLVASNGSPPFADGHFQYMKSPSDTHWKAVKRVLRYLIGTMEHGLYFSKGQFKLVCYSDADWASSIEDRRSTTRNVVYLGPNPVA
ncbi:hypothetical protein CXB51_001699 [Gossypium anomalum]|uniref:Reverse transcriptase Ty1/copia-type domain-containing protein n=1 Tax=Gossypium anomalum TaxID=47600 RepID=A0A8J5ZK34_9ROSI|nr:hypothetical protein CXB51_001699 [Gossypium anomalum]